MAGKTLNTLLSDLRTDLSDIPQTEWEAIELERAIERAIADLSRFLPRELIFDLTLTSTIIENSFTIDLDDYINEEDGMEELIRVHRVEYPANESPQKFCQFEIFAHHLTITGMGEASGQETLAEGSVLRIYYDSPHAMPEDEDAGTCPAFLDNTVLLASAAYALFQRALHFLHLADDDFTSARTALTNAATALAKVSTYLEDNSNEDAKGWLTKITTDIADLRTAINTALDAVNTYLDAVADDLTAADAADGYLADYVAGSSAPASKKYLGNGDAHLNKIADGGEGQTVPLAYRQYAEAVKSTITNPYERNRELLGQNATFRTNAAMIYAQESAQRLSNLRSYIEQADGWTGIARGFVNEAEQRLADSMQYTNLANQNITIADKLKEQATERRNEAWTIWRDRTQYIGDFAASSIRQMPH